MRYLLVISFLLTSAAALAQPQIIFHKTYGSAGFEKADRILQIEDTGYVVVGSSNLTGASSDVYLLKVDSLGNYLWSAYYGGNNVEHGTDIVQTPDSGFAICGYTNSYGNGGYDAYLVKVDKNGKFEWDTTFGGSDWDFAYGIEIMPDSGFVLIGETYSFGNGNNDMYVIRTDKNGGVIWEKTFGTSENEEGKDVLLTSNNELIILGNTNGWGAGDYDIFTARLTLTAGDTIWTKTYGDTTIEKGSRIKSILTYHNIVGYTNYTLNGDFDLYLVGIDDNGDTSYTFKHGALNQDEFGYDLDMRPPVDMFMAGDLDLAATPGASLNYLAYYTNYFGLFLAGRSFGTTGVDHCTSVAATIDDAFILAGHSEGFALAGGTDVYLVKMGVHPDFDPPDAFVIDDQYQDFTPVKEIVEASNLELNLFPNPATDFIHVRGDFMKAEYRITDLSGKLVGSGQVASEQPIDIRELPASTYFIRLWDDNHRETTIKFNVLGI